jgi:tetratricopeptide (TPR) repeat protein
MEGFDYTYLTIAIVMVIIMLRRLFKLMNNKLADIKPDRSLINQLTQIVKRTESFKGTLKSFAPNSPNGEKRRQKLMSLYNETLTRQSYHISTHRKVFELKKLYDRVTTNPRKYFGLIIWGLMLLNTNIFAQNLSSILDKANASYDKGNYQEAIDSYKIITKKDVTYKAGNVNYKIAIAYQKLKNCDSAVVYFKKAYQADNYKGGASSLDKFKEKIASCGLRMSDLQSNSNATLPAYDAEDVKKMIEEGNELYDKKKYRDALNKYYNAFLKSGTKSSASLCYKIAITYQKLKDCENAITYFKWAYQKDSNKAGASSIEKFEEKIKSCNLTLSQLKSSSQHENLSDNEQYNRFLTLKAKGDSLYTLQLFREGMEYYKMALTFDSSQNAAPIAYTIGYTYYYWDNCDSAKLFYAISYYLSTNDGGTSSRDEFNIKLSNCNLTIKDLRDLLQQWGKELPYDGYYSEFEYGKKEDVENIIGYILFGILFGVIGGMILREALVTPLYNHFFFNTDRVKLYINTIISDKYYWIGLSEKFPKKDVLVLQYVFENVGKNVFDKNDKKLLLELKQHVDWLKQNPERYLKNGWIDGIPNENYRWYLMGMLEFNFYCFFTGVRLDEGKSRVVAIIRKDGEVIKVWATAKVVDYIKNTPKNELVVKVRMHKRENIFVHWSMDENFYQPFDLPTNNDSRMQAWKSEGRNVDLQKYYDLYTNFPLTYIAPHPEAVADVYVDYIPFQEEPKTGFAPKDTPIVETSSSLNDVMTGVLIADTLSHTSHHHTDFDTPRDAS